MIVLVGELNPYGSDPRFALYDEPANSAGGRLRRKILGMHRRDYLKIPRYNLCVGRWSIVEARTKAFDVEVLSPSGAWMVMLGRKVAEAFGMSMMQPFEVNPSYRYMTLPHPSGRCLAWNEPGAIERARVLLRLVAPELPIGTVT